MPLWFNTILKDAGIELRDVRLVRHKDKRADRGLTPYDLWRDDRPMFESYQSTQGFHNHSKMNAPYWAFFLGTPNGETMFAGLYSVKYLGPLKRNRPMPHIKGAVEKAGSCDEYELKPHKALGDLIGKLFIEWGDAAIAWVQYPKNQNKEITELRTEFKEDDFPGFLNFIEPLSKLDGLPTGWKVALKSTKGIYLLTCPKTKEQYVGKADGEDGFWGRWQQYVRTGHGENVALKSRDPSDYRVSILEVAGTRSSPEEIIQMEVQWKSKLQSREMGLNRN